MVSFVKMVLLEIFMQLTRITPIHPRHWGCVFFLVSAHVKNQYARKTLSAVYRLLVNIGRLNYPTD